MQFSAGRNGIFEALAIATRAINGKINLPILGNVHVGASEDGIRISATDLYMAIECDVPATMVEVRGAVTVSGKVLQKIIKGLPKQDLSMAAITKIEEFIGADGKPRRDVECKAMLECGGTKFTLEGLPAEEFPAVPRPKTDVCAFSISQKELLKLIAATKFSIASDETRPTLMTARLSLENGRLQMVTTDTHRLTVFCAPLMEEPTNYDEKNPPLVPRKALDEVARIISDKSEDAVNVTFDEQTMRFQIGNIALTTRLEQGTFPNYMHVIPSDHHWVMLADRKRLIDGIKRIFIVAQDGSSYLMLRAHANPEEADGTRSPGDLRLVAWSRELGKAEHIMTVNTTGDPVPIAVNVNYLLDALEAMKGEFVRFELGEYPHSPMKLLETEDKDFLHLIMPLTVGELLVGPLS